MDNIHTRLWRAAPQPFMHGVHRFDAPLSQHFDGAVG